MKHRARAFASIACHTRDAASVAAQAEYGTQSVLLDADRAQRALFVCTSGMDVQTGASCSPKMVCKTTVYTDARNRIVPGTLRQWSSAPEGSSADPAPVDFDFACDTNPALSDSARCTRPLNVVLNRGAGPYLCKPLQMGADIVVEDLGDIWPTLLDGVVAVVAKSGTCLERFCDLARIESGCEPQHVASVSDQALLTAYATMGMVCRARCDCALVVAHFLAAHPRVEWVSYPGLTKDPSHEAACHILEHGFGWNLTCGIQNSEQVLLESSDLAQPLSACASRMQVLEPGVILFRAGLEDPLDVVTLLEKALGSSNP